MFRMTARALVRHGMARLNQGDPTFFLRMAAPEVTLRFPGDNSWARMFRPVEKGRAPHTTHRGIDECLAFAERFSDDGFQIEIEDILVNGPPWKTRVVVRAHDFLPGADGTDRYSNRLVDFLELRWGRLVCWEVYEDTERTAALDERTVARHAAGVTAAREEPT
jgi:ketosteroid isomerase-like protein